MSDYAIGLVGWGTVGGGVLNILQQDGTLLKERCNLNVRLKAIVTRNPDRARDQKPGSAVVGSDLALITDDPEIKTVLHLVGGTTAAKDIAIACLRAGKHVVTANKALLAEHWDELFAVAKETGHTIAFEAAVAGGIPVIAALRDGLVANDIRGIYSILNGTCNYILSRMTQDGMGYDEALGLAKDLGYAESDPTLDVNGTDTAHKLAILAQIAFNTNVPFCAVHIEGIENISADDIESAQRLDSTIKLLGVAKRCPAGVELRVAPTLVPNSNPLAHVNANYNAVRIMANNAGPTLLVGQGAGALPTASAVLSDLIDIAVGSYQRTAEYFRFFAGGEPSTILPEEDEFTASYARFRVKDEPGVLAQMTATLSKHGVSLRAVHQGEPDADSTAEIEVTTHPTRGGAFLSAVKEIDQAGITVQPTVCLRRLDEG
ncbi:MAG: homoserine dehydrogenase [Planctomycetota bacterium]|jgi:homoserine dehydrogenase|nr:homoserine dehydrogenase [Planctomycetota bacterium]